MVMLRSVPRYTNMSHYIVAMDGTDMAVGNCVQEAHGNPPLLQAVNNTVTTLT